MNLLVTAALPYANGSLHLGHLVEYCQVDIYVRAHRRLGHRALYICANDAHGTPIELNARGRGISPEELVAAVHIEHQRDFARFGVEFDHFGLTHSAANKDITYDTYRRLQEAGQIESRQIDGNWCDTDKRFLPDRFIKGECPKCGAIDQYGDVCEQCGATYSPTELRAPHCALCGATPVVRPTEHLFFTLSQKEHVAFLRSWIDSGALQPDVANYVRNWLDTGLKDWCISRDHPYFGFPVPDRPGKYFYVWLDAPLGYIAASAEWAAAHGEKVELLWRSDAWRIEHFIGKDIVYFHALFWPAVLRSAGFSLPSKVHVHGMLTINGEKMSKSRGTFVRADTFAKHIAPEALRYYYATKYSAETSDLDLSFEDFLVRVNAELLNKHANLFSRVTQFLVQKLDGKLGELPFTVEAAQGPSDGSGSSLGLTQLALAQEVVAHCKKVEGCYAAREFGQAMRTLALVADIGNEFMQSQKPWDLLRQNPEDARQVCTFVANVCHALAVYLWPVVPMFAEAAAASLGVTLGPWSQTTLFAERNRPIASTARLFERLLREQIDKVLEDTRMLTSLPTQESAAAAVGAVPALSSDHIGYDHFRTVKLKTGRVLTAEPIPKAKKLLRLTVDLGEPTPRQIVAGIALHYAPAELVGKNVVIVANLAPTKIMGVESQGMLLAADDGKTLSVVGPERELPAGSEVR